MLLVVYVTGDIISVVESSLVSYHAANYLPRDGLCTIRSMEPCQRRFVTRGGAAGWIERRRSKVASCDGERRKQTSRVKLVYSD